jgi:rhodanese-related sulfurtransferase
MTEVGQVPIMTAWSSTKGGTMSRTLADMMAAARAAVPELSPAQAAEADNNSELALIVDVREPSEFDESHVPGAVNIPRGLLEIRADPVSPSADPALSRDQAARILVYCTKSPGARSMLAAHTLRTMGYENVEVLGGGLDAWAEAGLPLVGEGQPATA